MATDEFETYMNGSAANPNPVSEAGIRALFDRQHGCAPAGPAVQQNPPAPTSNGAEPECVFEEAFVLYWEFFVF